MSKLSVFSKAISVAVLIALVLASLPTVSVVAKGNNQGLENKWSQLVDNYTRQSSNHNGAHRWVDHWLKTKKNASVSEKDEIQKHLNICNSAIIAAGSIISKHAGFDAKGKVIDRAAARKSIRDLSYYLRQHIGSIKTWKAISISRARPNNGRAGTAAQNQAKTPESVLSGVFVIS